VSAITRPTARLFLALLLAVPAGLSAQTEGELRGKVRSEADGLPLPAAIEISGGGVARSVGSNAAGAYTLRNVPAGRWTVRARHLGYAPFELEVIVPVGRALELDIMLKPDPVVLEPLRIHAPGVARLADTIAAAPADLGLAGARVLQSSPGLAEIGLTDAARGPPGQEPIDPGDVLYVRGAGADMKLVYLDGAPVYAPFPLGGLIDPFTPDLLQAADIYVGGAPARYDGGLSHVLDLRTRGARSDRVHWSGAVDLLSARGMLEVPVGSRGGFLLAARSVHGAGTGFVARDPLPYGYAEGLVRGDLQVGRTGVVSVTGFANAEEVWPSASSQPDSVIRWGNSALSLRYRGVWGETLAEVTAARGAFDARLPISGEPPVIIDGWADRSRIAADFTRRFDQVVLRYGTSYDRQEQGYTRTRPAAGEQSGTGAEADVLGTYGDVGWQIGSRLRLRGGVRADYFSLNATFAVAPRFSANWLLGDAAMLTLAAGRYHQYLRPTERGLVSRDLTPGGANGLQALTLGRATHFSVALAQELGDRVNLGVEGFYKSFDGLPGEELAVANASGVDVWVARDVGRWTGWAGYSLAWIWSAPDSHQNTRFAGRQLLSSGLDVPLGGSGKLGLGFTYGAGLPYSAIPIPTTQPFVGRFAAASESRPVVESTAGAAPLLPPEPSRPFLRFDVSASRTWTPRRGERPMSLTPYVRVLNTLGQRDALFYRYERDRDTAPRPLAVLPTVPVVGVEWKW
jgi:hypothetical protein